MANKKIVLDPSSWILDEDNNINFRYRILSDDFNVRSAFSPTYFVPAPTVLGPGGIFESIDYAATTEVFGGTTSIRLAWTTSPNYDNMKYFVFLNGEYLQTITGSSFSYAASAAGNYDFIVTVPNTTKTPLANTILFSTTVTI